MDSRSTQISPLPAHIGPYPIRRLIGSGAMGLVYLGHDPAINRPVAIKTIHRHLLHDTTPNDNSLERFRVEAQAAGRLQHPGIVSIYQFGEDHDYGYLAMEYVDGQNLSDLLARPTRFSREDVLCLMQQLLEALDFAHENGVVHRDIKPANLLISRDGRLKITDFGIARLEANQQLTQANMMVGSPGFMAPEQYLDGPIDRRADVFAAGVLLYQLLCGTLPFRGPAEAVMYKVLHEPPEPLPHGDDGRDLADFWPVVLTALAKRPEQRYQSAGAMQQALVHLARGKPIDRLLAITCILPAPGRASGAPATTAPAPGTGTPAGLHATHAVPTGWNEATLAGLEHDLARHLGPIAKVVVRKSARHFATLEAVRQDVASAISDPSERQLFLHETETLSGSSAGVLSAPPSSASVRSPTVASGFGDALAPPGALTNDELERIGALLTRVVGPIAKVLIRRCAAQTRVRHELIEQLLGQLGGKVDVHALRSEILKVLH